MRKKLALRGHSTRGNEVIELLKMMGGKNNCDSPADNLGLCYLIDDEFDICAHYFGYDDYEDGELNIFTLEEFLEKYPYKVGDKVFDKVDGDPGIITAMKWDEDVYDMKYHVAFDNGDMGWYTNDTIEFLNLEDRKTMNKKLAIKGHPIRGKEVIYLLKMMGGKNTYGYDGEMKSLYFTISNDTIIYGNEKVFLYDNYVFFTLEEFLEKYPFKVDDKVFLYDNITEGYVTGMKWDEDKGTVKYCVYTSGEYWCDVEELLKWNNIDLNERHYMEEKDKAKAPDIKGEDYSGKRFGYKIPDGYEFDVVVDGKIFIKPIKSRYQKTYTECCEILGIGSYFEPEIRNATAEECRKFAELIRLKRCRDAYWKIAGEQMGLGKPWEPDWKNGAETKYTIVYSCSMILNGTTNLENKILAFPTEEMRDAFYENFKELIESCKELL